MRAIDADKLMPKFIEKAFTMQDRHGVKLGENWLLDYNDIQEVIDNASTVPLPDFKEGYKQAIIDGKTNFSKLQGEWKTNMTTGDVFCSCCKEVRRDTRINHINFCNSCGADMRTKNRMSEEEYEQNVGRLYTDEGYLGGEEE